MLARHSGGVPLSEEKTLVTARLKKTWDIQFFKGPGRMIKKHYQ